MACAVIILFMKVIVSVAMSVNGMIAAHDGSEDFLSHQNWIAFAKLANKIGNNIWGRKTYEAVKAWPPQFLADIKDVTKIVISKGNNTQGDGFVFVNSPQSAIDYLKNHGFSEALVTGGQSVYSSFIKERLADEIIFTVEPALLGNGIPAFNFEAEPIKLKLLNMRNLEESLLELHYKVLWI